MSFEQIVTYIVAPLAAAGAAIWGLVKWVIPKFVDAKLTEQKDVREHRQKMDALQTEYLKAEAETTYQMMGSLLEKSQEKEDKANEFIRETVFNEIRDLSRRFANLENRQQLLSNLITGGKVVEAEEPIGDYEAWKKSKLDDSNQPPIGVGSRSNDQA